MQAFQMKDDQHRIYFRNFERGPAEEELEGVLKDLQRAGCHVGKKQEAGLEDVYRCTKERMEFHVIFTGEEAFIYSDNIGTIQNLLPIFE